MAGSLHEQFDRPEMPLPPDRSTGLVLAAFALTVAYVWRSHEMTKMVALSLAAVLAVLSFAKPSILRPLNIAWMRFAGLLSMIMNPIVMLVLFALVIVPAGLIMQLCRDPLRQRKADKLTYWITPVRNERSSMANQF